MSTFTEGPRIVVGADAPREVWLAERGEGVTASEAWRIARGGLKARKTIVTEKMNGSTFRGNKFTRAGSEREAAILDELSDRRDVRDVTPNSALWAAAANDLHRATPDATAIDVETGEPVVVEVKSHAFGWKFEGIPIEHVAQLMWQMHVLGAAYGLYGFEVRDEDDQPPQEGATWIRVERDEEFIEYLVTSADRFIAWREDGCPDVDDLPDTVETAFEDWAAAKKSADTWAAAEKKANAALKAAITSEMPYAARFGAVGNTPKGGFQHTVSEVVSIDEDALRAAYPQEHARIQQLRVDLAFAEAQAKRTHPKITRRTALRYQEA